MIVRLMNSRKQFLIVALLAGLVLLVLLPSFFLLEVPPSRDSGVFLYIGEQIVKGKIPYRDVWDHKGPLLYYLNALGVWLGNGAFEGIWFVEYFWLLATVVIGFKLLQEAFGVVPAILSTIIWVINSYYLQMGNNLTEEYNLLFQFAALYLFWRSLKSQNPTIYYFVIGLTLGAAFLLRPNNIGTHFCLIVYLGLTNLFAKNGGGLIRLMAAISAGFVVIVGLTAVYFAHHHALDDLIDQFFIYNITYANASAADKWISIMAVLVVIVSFDLTIIVVTSWILGLRQAIGKQWRQKPWAPLAIVALMGLPIETFLAGFSGWVYFHYAMTLLPVIAILVAVFLSGLSANVGTRFPVAQYGVLLIVLVWATYRPLWYLVADLRADPESQEIELLADIETAASEYDSLVMWGAETSYNLMLEKEAPTRYVYQYPLFSLGYTKPEMVDEFLSDIMSERPLIVDTSATNGRIPPLDPDLRAEWSTTPSNEDRELYIKEPVHLQDVFDFIEANYKIVGVAGEEWPIYAYVDD